MFFIRLGLVLLYFSVSCQTKKNKDSLEVSKNLGKENFNQLSQGLQGTWEKDSYYELIIEQFPQHDGAWMSRSVAYNKRGMLDKGFHFLNTAVELSPEKHLGYRGFVKLYMMHDYSGALEDFLEYDNISKDDLPVAWGEDLYKLIGLSYLRLNQLEEAEDYLQKSITLNRKVSGISWVEPRSILYLAIAQFKNHKYEESKRTLIEGKNTFSKMSCFPFWLSKIYIEDGDWTLAKQYLKESKELFIKYRDNTNPYFEIPYQLYMSDYNELSEHIP